MATQSLVLICLPNGIRRDNGVAAAARLSVYLSPRLSPEGDGTLAGFDFADWPAALARAQFTIAIGAKTIAATRVGAADSDFWRALFPADMLVRPYVADAASRMFASYPAARMQDHLRTAYGRTGLAVATDAPPDARTFADRFGEMVADAARGLSDDDVAARVLAPDPAVAADALRSLSDSARGRRGFSRLMPKTGELIGDLAQFAAFHQNAAQPARRIAAADVEADERLDFHQRLTTLAEYPAALRRLGLLIDLEVPPTAIPDSALSAPASLRIQVAFSAPFATQTVMLTPATAYHAVIGQTFVAAPHTSSGVTSETVAGLLNLRAPTADDDPTPQFDIVQIDIEDAGSAAIKVLQDEQAANDQAPHPIRTSGLSIVRADQAERLDDALTAGITAMGDLAAGKDVTFFAEDLVRGYRIDIRPTSSGHWRSLHQRDGAYAIGDGAAAFFTSDEGAIQPAMTHPDAAAGNALDAAATNHVSESLFLWQGWSLSAPRPGNRLADPTSAAPEGLAPADETGPALTATFSATRGTLPRLRFGETYHLRARLVDLAGNGLSTDEADAVLANFEALGLTQNAPFIPADAAGYTFRRFEPITSPAIATRAPLQEGEAADRIVLRSNFDVAPDAYGATYPQYALSPERHLLAPKSWLQMVETCGMLDATIAPGADPAKSYQLAARTDVALPDQAIIADATTKTAYLPDPLAAGAALRDLPGADAPTLIDFADKSAWPDLPGIRVRLIEGDAAPVWDAASRTLTVALAKAETRTITLSCSLDQATPDLLGQYDWMAQQLEAALEQEGVAPPDRDTALAGFRHLAIAGGHAMLTPARQVTLVHAIQQPLTPPVIATLTATRLPYATEAFLTATIPVHMKSTAELSLTARWTDRIDDPLPQPPETVAQVMPPFAVPADGNTPLAPGTLPNASFDFDADAVLYAAADTAALEASLRAQLTVIDQTYTQLDTLLSNPPYTPANYGRELAAIRPLLPVFRAAAVRVPLLAHWPEAIAAAMPIRQGVINILVQTLGNPGDPLMVLGARVADTTQGLQAFADQAVADLVARHGRQNFGDTRHRRVTYQAIGTTRFAGFFPEAVTSDVNNLVRASEPVVIDIPSSAPPEPPIVSYIVPTYRWTRAELPGGHENAREGGGMRVYLERPWFSSGDGEMLAVLLGPSPDTPGFAAIEPFVSRAGRDPIWASSAPPLTLDASHFRASAATATGLRPQDAQAPNGMGIVAYPVAFDDQGRCYCDIALDLGASYMPFVRLSLARYQPSAIPGFELSTANRTDFIQVAPDRAISLHAWDQGYALSVTGTSHASPTSPSDPNGARHGTTVRVSFWQRLPGTTDEAGWVPAGPGYGATSNDTLSGDLIYNGVVTLPADHVPGSVRIRIEEVESFLSQPPLQSPASTQQTDRVVFVETIDL
ncbi:hypothetical protein HL653_17395 [Sphingomonas sp. AP4-R1]|uniref:hypothetical protein n=1 Tax=Sphingomonas sp. AP4-R1 TaxID=2735134 RepID=UPI001493AC6D|nr:hypothetical protein [Sphingomonas sp. AP4-R1]QJU59297.1 hypothetical protein HL653_17395 [Sphingomonas sp. AP4-R1]